MIEGALLEYERGGIIGTAMVVDCVRESDSPWFFGRWGFVLAGAKPVPFIPVKGALGFFRWQVARLDAAPSAQPEGDADV